MRGYPSLNLSYIQAYILSRRPSVVRDWSHLIYMGLHDFRRSVQFCVDFCLAVESKGALASDCLITRVGDPCCSEFMKYVKTIGVIYVSMDAS